MNSAWFIASYFALWATVLVALLAIVALLRQVGLLNQRLGPGRAYSAGGPASGTDLGALSVSETLANTTLEVATSGGVRRVLIFVQPGCSVCEVMAPALAIRLNTRLGRGENRYALVVMTDAPEFAFGYASDHKYDLDRVAVGNHIAVFAQVESVPFAIVLDDDWIVLASGIVNSTEQIDSLLEQAELQTLTEMDHPDDGLVDQGAPADPATATGVESRLMGGIQ